MGLGCWVGECGDLFGGLEVWGKRSSSDLERYEQESEPQEGPGTECNLTKDGGEHWAASPMEPNLGEVQYVRLGQLWLTPGHTGAPTHGLHPTHPHTAAQKFLSSKNIPAAQMTNTAEQPTATGKG